MARPATGSIQQKHRAGGEIAYIARFSAMGQRRAITLGTSNNMRLEEAEAELRQLMKKVHAGVWEPPESERSRALQRNRTVRDILDAYFKDCASRGLKENTLKEYEWRISYVDWHLGDILLSDLTREDVIEFRDGRLTADLSTKSVNSFIQTLAAALEEEVELGNLERNVAKGRGRTVKLVNKALSRPFMDYDQVEALLDAATHIEEQAREQYQTGRRYLLAVMWFGGLRVTEACRLTWGDWDQIAGTLGVGESKTDAGIREVVVLKRLHEELTEWKARCQNTRHDAPMFPNASGGHRDRSNVSNRVINNRLREEAERIYRERHGDERRPLPDGITAHDGRRAYASWTLEAAHNPAWVQRQLGHTDPSMTLRVYARVSDRAPDRRIQMAMERKAR